MKTFVAFLALSAVEGLLIASPAAAQSLLGDAAGSPYDPPPARAWKKHDRLQIRFGAVGIAAEVADVRPNGVLVVEGVRRRGADGAFQTLRVTGELAPEAVVNGEAASDRVAKLCVSFDGSAAWGLPSWLGRLFEGAAPN